jgi:hypothetical protein
MEQMRADQFWARLVDALQLLAADYETQREAIPNFAHLPDELALIYSESLLCIEQHTDELVDSGFLSGSALQKLRELDDTLARMSGKPGLWTIDALTHSSEWQQVRERAREILRQLGVPLSPPKLDWISYIEASARETRIN